MGLPLTQADRSRAAELELQSFSYIVSHDLAASFRHISEFSRLLLGDLADTLTPSQSAHAMRVRMATENCQLMMEQLLAFSRIQQKPLCRISQDAGLTLRLPVLQLAATAAAAGADVEIEPLGEVIADHDLLALIFHHLLDNAIKFGRPGVNPKISVRPAHDQETWRVRICDNGPGVEPPYREKAFQMFHRLNAEGAYPGVGAGLAICRRIARLHGGELAFVDAAEGACLELALPRATVAGQLRPELQPVST